MLAYTYKCDVKCNFYSLSSQILASPMVYSHIFAYLYRQQRFGQNFLLTHIGNRGFKVPSTSRSSKLIWVKSKEANQVQTALLQGLPWLICIRENISRL